MRTPLVLHIAPVLWSGAGSVITRLCETQRRSRRVAIVTAALAGDEADWRPYRARLRKAGIPHTAIDFFHREPGVFWPGVFRLAALLGELTPAVVHAHAGVPTAAAVCARDLAGVRPRIVGHMYSWGVDRPDWMDQQDGWGFARADRVISSSRDYTERLTTLGVPAGRIGYIPWGLPLDALPFSPPSARQRARADAPRLGFVGRIERRKGQLDLVRAFSRVLRTRPAATLELVGPVAEPEYADRIAREITERGLQHAVTRHGTVRDVPRILGQWTLFVSMSSDEGQGLAIMEAMALGVPVLARPVAGVADFLVDGQNGVAVRSGAPGAISQQIETLLSSPALADRLARNARRMIEKHYAWDLTVKRIEAIYR